MQAEATGAERAAVDRVLASVPEVRDGQVGRGGLRFAQRHRTLLLPALHALQDAVGGVTRGGLDYVCDRLLIPPAEAFAVASFYHLFHVGEEPPPSVVRVCDDVVCLAAGAEEVLAAAGSDATHRSPCLGFCDRAPAALVQRTGETNLQIGPVTAVEPLPSAAAREIPAGTVGGEPLRLLARIDAQSTLEDHRSAGGFAALEDAVRKEPEQIVAAVVASGLRGRGGAAFPAGAKWEAVAEAAHPVRYVVCNADESEPGTFKDRVLLEGDPWTVLEGLILAGYAVGARRGYVYVRGEYPRAEARLAAAIDACRSAGYLGSSVAGSEFSFDVEIRRGAGAYICGEETALFESIEGKRGEPRQKPPFPTQVGLFGKPTVVNNVETLANVPGIVLDDGASFAALGTAQSAGTKLFSVSGAVSSPGCYEVEFGATLGEVIALAGGERHEISAVLVGGAAGSFVLPDRFSLPLTFEDTRSEGIPLGSGALVAFGRDTDFAAIVRRIARFFADESCGQCVPCRVGTVRQVEALARLATGEDEIDTLGALDRVMRDASICGLGQFAGNAVQSALQLGLIGGKGSS